MNVVISNQKNTQLSSLDIDVIKNVTGTFEVDEIVSM